MDEIRRRAAIFRAAMRFFVGQYRPNTCLVHYVIYYDYDTETVKIDFLIIALLRRDERSNNAVINFLNWCLVRTFLDLYDLPHYS